METLTSIAFTLDAEELAAELHVAPGSHDADALNALVKLAQDVGRPKAGYTVSYIRQRDGDTIQVEDVCFTSRALVHNLKDVERVFPVVATCGHELDAAFTGQDDILHAYWWDVIKTHLLAAANGHLHEHLRRTYRLGKTSMMLPGSGDVSVWPLEQQAGLFELLGDTRDGLGVQLTESFLMIPNKTTSGLLFETERTFESCEVCRREDCPSRRAPLNVALWEAIQRS